MIPKKIHSSILGLVVFLTLISSGICCNNGEFKCGTGECIALEELCDGNTDCLDGSDETADSCIQQSCPSFAFRCAYGACVSGSAECNGIKECADNSDEATAACKPEEATKESSKCQYEEFECKSGECIDLDSACDGRSDCKDQSDETVQQCASNTCPPFAFRCGYGGCISKNKKCDGKPDCRDGSDEAIKLCPSISPVIPSKRPTSRPPVQPTPSRPPWNPDPKPTIKPPTPKPTVEGCIAPNLPNSRLVYELDQTTVIKPGEIVPDLSSMVYQCEPGYNREGPQFNLCFKLEWINAIDATCTKFCPSHKLKGVTFKAECFKDDVSVPCDDRIKPGTIAKVSCQLRYKKPDRNPPDTLVCQDDGQWDYEPFRCEPICGEELTRIAPFIVNGDKTNITYVPWHVGIYSRFDGTFKHICGATIISAKVVVSAAHCFWDPANEIPYDKSFFLVGAGKYYRDYRTYEQNAVFQNISEISIPPEFKGENDAFRGDIAVLVLTNFLRFSPFIAPVCIDWQWGAAKSIASQVWGRIAGWGLDETGTFSNDLRSVDVPTTSYSDCKEQVGQELASSVKDDKFCVINKFGSVVCQGDSGGGFTVKKVVNGKNVYFLWGIVSGGVPYGRKCSEFEFVSYTNIQFFEHLIMSRLNTNRPK